MEHLGTVQRDQAAFVKQTDVRSRRGGRRDFQPGRPPHPALRLCESLVEAIIAVKDDAEAFEYGARVNGEIGAELIRRAEILRATVAPKIREGYNFAEAAVLSDHPVVRAHAALMVALREIACDREALDHAARAVCAVGRALHERAQRLRLAVLPEIESAVAR